MTLDETYKRILLGIDKEKCECAIRLLQCLAFSRRPLLAKELAEVLSIQFDRAIPTLDTSLRPVDADEAVLSACSTLVAIITPDGPNNNLRLVQFSHYSVKEFLTSERLAKSDNEDLSRYHISPEPAHTILAQSCISTLLQPDIHIRDITNAYPLANYAAQNWFHHAQCDDVAFKIQDGMERLFDPNRNHFSTWILMYDIDNPRTWRHPTSASPLYYAALCGIGSLVEHLLITRQQNPNQSYGSQGTPLHVAVVLGHTTMARLLLEHSADVDARDMNTMTPLHAAVRSGRLDIAQLLLSHGADVDALDRQGYPPLHEAVRSQKPDLVDLLLKGGANVNFRSNGSMYNPTPLHGATSSGNLCIARLLLSHGADVNSLSPQGDTPLHRAVRLQKLDLVELLLKGGADVNVRSRFDQTPLHEAASHKKFDIAQLLLSYGADVNTLGHQGPTLLHKAIRSQKLDLVELLLQGGVDVNVRSMFNPTQLHEAASSGNPDIVRLLLSHGASVNTFDYFGDSPLHKALQPENFDLVEFPDNSAADVNTWQHRTYATAQLLLGYGADVDARGTHHKTPLHLASLKGFLDVSRLLIEHGADIDAQDNDGQTPFSVALAHGHRKLARFLSLANDRVPEHDA